jgi:predicted Zn finger-like uncharacterized protein
MVLATRCPHCETVFRLSDAQLASSAGWVRCGHCQAVFDATASLVDPETGESPVKREPQNGSGQYSPGAWDMWSPQSVAHANSVPKHDGQSVSRSPFIVPGALTPVPDEADQAPTSSRQTETLAHEEARTAEPEPAPAPAPEPAPAAAPAIPAANGVSKPASAPSGAAEPAAKGEQELHKPAPSPAAADDLHKPEPPAHTDNQEPRFSAPHASESSASANAHADFASSDARNAEPTLPRDAQTSSATWRDSEPRFHDARPGQAGAQRAEPFAAQAAAADGSRPFEVTREARESAPRRTLWRMIGGLIALVLAVLLVGELAWWRREAVMVYWPESQVLFERACARLGCHISPPRDIDGLQVEASDLRQVDGPHRLELRVPLRNRYNIGLAYPAIELTLFDSKNEVAIRRVLWPQDYVQPGTPIAAGLPARTTQTMVVRLDTGDVVATNFRVQIFYP